MSAPHSLRTRYKLRWKRRKLLWRGFRQRHALRVVRDLTGQIGPHTILCFACIRNEAERLPHWLDHYRAMGIDHFLIVDNDSDDDSQKLLLEAPDVSLWVAEDSYRSARFGMDWINGLLRRFGQGRWCLTVDADELLVYPGWPMDTLREVTARLDSEGRMSFGALMVELYPKGRLSAATFQPGDNPLDTLRWFDPTAYRTRKHTQLGTDIYQGGVRDRVFFAQDPMRAPTLNKVPLVKWHWRWAYLNSTHSLLPNSLNQVFSTRTTPHFSGALLHTKFLPSIVKDSALEKERNQHFWNGALYHDYYDALIADPDLWYVGSELYRGPDQLEALGFMSRGT